TRKLCPHCEPERQGYSGQLATNCSWMRAPLVEHASGDQNRKSAFAIRRCRGDRLHSVPHPPFGLPPCVSKRRLVALSRCPDADCMLPASVIRWNGTKVWNVINRDLVSKISGQNKTQGSPRHTTPFESRGLALLNFPLYARASRLKRLTKPER